MVCCPYPIFGLETVLLSLFLPSRNHNLHPGIIRRMMRCNARMSLRFGSGWPAIYFSICFCMEINAASRDAELAALPGAGVGEFLGRHEIRQIRCLVERPDLDLARTVRHGIGAARHPGQGLVHV